MGHEAAVAKLVAGPRALFIGPRVHICDRCVEVARELMEQKGGDGPRHSSRRMGLVRRALNLLRSEGRGRSRRAISNASAALRPDSRMSALGSMARSYGARKTKPPETLC